MKAIKRNILIFAGACALIGLDQLFKWLAIRYLSDVTTFPLIDGVFHLTYVENRGASFGIFQGNRLFLIVFTSVLLLALIVAILKNWLKHPLLWWAAALFLGGGIGNLIDRIFRHFVVDYLDFCLIHFAVFNFADCCVVIATALVMIYILFFMEKGKNHSKKETSVKEEKADA